MTPTIREHSWFDRALHAADLPSMTIHDLRHTAASLAISAGANVKAIQKMLGHAFAARIGAANRLLLGWPIRIKQRGS